MQKQQGFSLIEIMVVVVILGILAALVVPNIIGRSDEARVVKAKHDILAIQSALDLYKLDNGTYPNNEQGLVALVKRPTTDPIPTHWQSYLKSIPKDPWGRDYIYTVMDDEVSIITYGADGQVGGTGLNADISNGSIN